MKLSEAIQQSFRQQGFPTEEIEFYKPAIVETMRLILLGLPSDSVGTRLSELACIPKRVGIEIVERARNLLEVRFCVVYTRPEQPHLFEEGHNRAIISEVVGYGDTHDEAEEIKAEFEATIPDCEFSSVHIESPEWYRKVLQEEQHRAQRFQEDPDHPDFVPF